MCNRSIFDPGLEGFVAVDCGHGLDEKEGHEAGDCAENEECESRTEGAFISQFLIYFEGPGNANVNHPAS
jgi:hypothetical protein